MVEHNIVTRVRHILNPERDAMRVSSRALAGFLASAILFLTFVGWYDARSSNAADDPKPTAKLLPIPDMQGRLPKPSQLQVHGTVVDESGIAGAAEIIHPVRAELNGDPVGSQHARPHHEDAGLPLRDP